MSSHHANRPSAKTLPILPPTGSQNDASSTQRPHDIPQQGAHYDAPNPSSQHPTADKPEPRTRGKRKFGNIRGGAGGEGGEGPVGGKGGQGGNSEVILNPHNEYDFGDIEGGKGGKGGKGEKIPGEGGEGGFSRVVDDEEKEGNRK